LAVGDTVTLHIYHCQIFAICWKLQVWKATSIETGDLYALKVVFWENPAVKEHHKRILCKEVEILNQLNHENIVKMHEHMDNEHQLVIVLEFLKGGGLLEHLYEVEHYSESEAACIFRQLVSAVEYAHSKSIIHRDIKPENAVFVQPISGHKRRTKSQLQVKLVDFGLARYYSNSRSVKARLGSPGFMAPEVSWCFCNCIHRVVLCCTLAASTRKAWDAEG
jgi:serine/threonine protein kinase